jgi:hypothetical protein
MIDRLEKSAALISINGKAGPDDRVAFIFVNQFCFFLFSGRVIRGSFPAPRSLLIAYLNWK